MSIARITAERRAKLAAVANRARKNVASNNVNRETSMEKDDLNGMVTPVTTDDLLTCSICLERYQDTESSGRQPKILPCFHTFCRRCLEQMVIQQNASSSSRGGSSNTPIRAIISCPQCRRLIAVPNGGASAFQTNFYIIQMTDLMQEVNKGNSASTLTVDDSFDPGTISSHISVRSSSPAPKAAVETCAKHSNWPLLFYCKMCSQRICSNCTVLDHKESEGHVIVDVQAMVDEAMKDVLEKTTWAEGVVQTSKTLIQKGQSELGQLNVGEDTVCSKLNKIGENVAKLLSNRLKNVQDQVRAEMLSRRQAIRNETCSLIDLTRSLEKKRRDITIKTTEPSPAWILDGRADEDLKEIAELGRQLEETVLDPRYFLNFGDNILSDAAIQELCERLIPVPHRRELPKRIELVSSNAIAGQYSTLSVVLQDSDSTLEAYPLRISLVDPEGEMISMAKTVYKSEAKCYNTNYLASQSGEYGIYADINGFPIDCREVRFSADTNEPIAIVGERGSTDGKFNKPVSVLVSAEDQALLVAEFENQRIQIFDPKTLAFKSKFSVSGEGSNYPGSIATFNLGTFREVVCPKVIIAEEGRLSCDTIQIFDMNSGKLVTSFQNKILRKALHVSVNSYGRIIVSDRDANGLFVFNREGALMGRIGRQGTGPGQFNCPVFIACGLDDDILVADSANNRVQILDKIGVFKTEIGATGRGRLGAPAGIAVDSFGNILVADSDKNCVQMYTKDGQYLASLKPSTNALICPRGVAAWAADGTKRVFVIDRGNHSVKTLSYM